MANNENINSPTGTNSNDFEAADGSFEEAVLECLRTDFWLRHAMDIIKADDSVDVSVYAKNKDLLKYGQSDQCQTTLTTLMTLPTGTFNETYVATNAITHFASDAAGDTEDIVVKGHTVSGGVFTFVTQTVTLAGTTKTALTTPLARATRAYANGSTDLVGNIYIAEDVTFTAGVPQTDSAVHLMIPAGQNQSQKASTTIEDGNYWILTSFHGHFLEKAAGFADVVLEVRESGGVFREVDNITVNDGTSQGEFKFCPYIIVPPNSDVRLRATVDVNGKSVGGSIQGVLVKTV